MEDNNTSKIDLYLDEKLSEQEKIDFEKDLESDATLKKEVQTHRLERLAIEEMVKNRYREKIKKLRAESTISWEKETANTEVQQGKEHPKETKMVKMSQYKKYLGIAAGILLLIVAGNISNANLNYSNTALFSENYIFPGFSEVIGTRRSDNIESLLSVGGNAYQEEDDDKAIQILSSIPETSSDYNAAQFNLGNLYLKKGVSQKAINAFRTINEGTKYQEEIDWYLALALLQQNNITQAKVELDKILQTPNHSFLQKASDLNNSLGSFYRKLLF